MTEPSFEEKYYDVLRALEIAIVETYRQYPDLVDFNVSKVLEGLERGFVAEKKGRKPPTIGYTQTEKSLRERLEKALNLFLGRDANVQLGAETRTVDDVLACIKRIQRSVQQMRDKGRQAYLDFLDSFFQDGR